MLRILSRQKAVDGGHLKGEHHRIEEAVVVVVVVKAAVLGQVFHHYTVSNHRFSSQIFEDKFFAVLISTKEISKIQHVIVNFSCSEEMPKF